MSLGGVYQESFKDPKDCKDSKDRELCFYVLGVLAVLWVLALSTAPPPPPPRWSGAVRDPLSAAKRSDPPAGRRDARLARPDARPQPGWSRFRLAPGGATRPTGGRRGAPGPPGRSAGWSVELCSRYPSSLVMRIPGIRGRRGIRRTPLQLPPTLGMLQVALRAVRLRRARQPGTDTQGALSPRGEDAVANGDN